MVNFCGDKKATNVEDKFDLEMQELAEFSMHSPGTLLAAKRRKASQANPETDGEVEGVTSTPISSPKFPAPPVFSFCFLRRANQTCMCRQHQA